MSIFFNSNLSSSRIVYRDLFDDAPITYVREFPSRFSYCDCDDPIPVVSVDSSPRTTVTTTTTTTWRTKSFRSRSYKIIV
ncbi:unnamed protein product [Adineta steineri]|uniref:Uncharacterized protein n=1 Tax=Adineta steineri TaxID=433720 RepID=A0A818WDK0_9BILA|nr:unnamed protein product [Adineta steineri]CAF3722733.1 unnamed protein product [Adineta steineri]